MDVMALLDRIDPGIALNVAVLLALAGVFARKVWPALRRLVHLADKLERFEQLERDVATIKGEVTYNHGGSLKDAVRRIEQGQTSQDAQLERLHLAVFNNGPTA